MDHKGDPTKQPPECASVFTPYSESFPRPSNVWENAQGEWSRCANLRETYSDFEVERYGCEVCGKSYSLYYEDMA